MAVCSVLRMNVDYRGRLNNVISKSANQLAYCTEEFVVGEYMLRQKLTTFGENEILVGNSGVAADMHARSWERIRKKRFLANCMFVVGIFTVVCPCTKCICRHSRTR